MIPRESAKKTEDRQLECSGTLEIDGARSLATTFNFFDGHVPVSVTLAAKVKIL